MAVPKFHEFCKPILNCLKEQKSPVAKKEVLTYTVEYFKPTKEDLEDVISNGSSRFIGNMTWAIVYLNKAELIEYASKGIYQITNSGLEFLQTNIHIDLPTLKQIPALKSWLQESKKVNNKKQDQFIEESVVPEETINLSLAHDEHFEDVKFKLLDHLLTMGNSYEKGDKFEKICLSLLLKVMNFHHGEQIGGAGDKGVDLKLYMDRFEINSIGVQCKCQQNPVSAKDINHLRGGLEEHGLDKGVFITTARFSPDAKERVKSINGTNTNIVLIDGQKLAELMMEYDVGIQKQVLYEYHIDFQNLIEEL